MLEKQALTIKEAAETLEVSPGTIRRKIKQGQLIAEKVEGIYGPQWVIDPESLTRASQTIEVIPVKHNLNPDKLEDLITKATKDAAEAGTLKAMEEYKDTMQELTQAIISLKSEVEELRQERENLTTWEKVKGIFSK